MSRRVLLAAVVMAVFLVPAVARASSGWSWPVTGEPVLRYGASYTNADGHTCSHGGLDIGAPTGTDVRACAPGEVVFAGLVPAGAGARAWAVTVLTSDGLRVTYLPLSSAAVHKAQDVTAGSALGVLAASGDASGGSTHLHLGVKRGDTPLDPLAFLAAPASALSGGSQEAPAPSHAPAPAKAHMHAPAPAQHAPSPSVSPAPHTIAAPGAAPAPAGIGAADPAASLGAALRTLSHTPALSRVEPVASAPVLDLARAQADLFAKRDAWLSIAARLGLLLVAGGCAWPVMRAARVAGARAVPAPAPARRDS